MKKGMRERERERGGGLVMLHVVILFANRHAEIFWYMGITNEYDICKLVVVFFNL
jgi:hypothetical protein